MPLSKKQAAVRDAEAREQIAGYAAIKIRTLKPGEAFPQHMDTGFENLPVMNDFVWVAEKSGKIVGILMAAPCHGIVFLVRLRTVKDAPAMTVSLLFRRCVRDWRDRGFKGYFTYVDPSRDLERRFIPICRKLGGLQLASMQVGLVGNLEQAQGILCRS